jgi:spermidine/putrescine transport system permease protein
MNSRLRGKLQELLFTLPSAGWLAVFFIIPTVLIVLVSFRNADAYGGIGAEWTLDTFRELLNPIYPPIFFRTVWISLVSTVIALLIALPCGYYIARAPRKIRDLLLVLVIVPFWTNFLIRIIAWKVLLHPEGFFKKFLVMLSLASPDSLLLYRTETVIVVLIYSHLPFAILPIYAAAEKFDYALIEAARDLGASRFAAFIKVFLPGISAGLFAAFMVVFIPALGSYLIPVMVGGTSIEMIGSKIAQRTFQDRNLPHASALSLVLMCAVFLPLFASVLYRRFRSGGGER